MTKLSFAFYLVMRDRYKNLLYIKIYKLYFTVQLWIQGIMDNITQKHNDFQKFSKTFIECQNLITFTCKSVIELVIHYQLKCLPCCLSIKLNYFLNTTTILDVQSHMLILTIHQVQTINQVSNIIVLTFTHFENYLGKN